MLKQFRQSIIQSLWQSYRAATPQAHLIEAGLKKRGETLLALDHFAIIDLPGPHSGIPPLNKLFALLGYIERGRDYLPSKQNDFLWMTEEDSMGSLASDVLPQIVIADFRLNAMPATVRHIIQQYSSQAKALPFNIIEEHIKQMQMGNANSAQALRDLILHYLTGRDWPLPTVHEFLTVQAFNELLAWVLIFGRQPNHFTLSIHLMNSFANLTDFLHFIEHDLSLTLNTDGGTLKGSQAVGIEQGSTIGMMQRVQLADGAVELPTKFMEFAWRHPLKETGAAPTHWDDYFTGFVAQHANRVIESLYLNEALSN